MWFWRICLWIIVVLAFIAVASLLYPLTSPMWLLRITFWLGLAIIIAVALIPVSRFLLYQWESRRQEFINRLHGPISFYLSRFHGEIDLKGKKPIEMFMELYKRLASRHLYAGPVALLFFTLLLEGGLVTATAIRAGYEQYANFYHDMNPIRLSLGELDAAFSPTPRIVLTIEALAAIAGAYLYTVGVVIQGQRARTLVPSDLLWCSFRLLIAVPMGLAWPCSPVARLARS